MSIEAPKAPPTPSRKSVDDKRAALLEAATRLFAQNGLQSVSTASIAREAGVAKGTLFVYFETKEHLFNALYLDIATRFIGFIRDVFNPADTPDTYLRTYWFAFARWYLDHSAACTVMLQCEIASVLTPETEEEKKTMEEDVINLFFPDIREHLEGSLKRYIGYAFMAGPIQVLAQMRDKGEIKITDEILERTFTCFEKAFSSIIQL